MNLGETIKKLRVKKNITQEQLAEYLNISSQAVSKWETNISLPDITLIPMLANIFDVTSDALLGIYITAKEKRIDEILRHADEYRNKGYSYESAEILREGLKEYPNSHKIMVALMSSVFLSSYDSYKSYETPEDRKNEIDELRKEIVYLGEKILAECTDDECRQTAIPLLCYTYPTMGETEKAEKLALTLSGFRCSDLLCNIYSGDKQFRQKQNWIYENLTLLFVGMEGNNHPLDNGNLPYTKEERIAIFNKIVAILEIVFEDEDYGYNQQRMAWSYAEIARLYAELGDFGNAMKNLMTASVHSIKSDLESSPDKEYTSLLFRGKKLGGATHNVTVTDSMKQLEVMKYKVFDAIRENKDFIEIEDKLKKYAKKR